MFSRKHDLFCCKKGKAWLTGYSWHSRKAGRAKVGAEANLHLYVPRAGRGAALHLAGHPPRGACPIAEDCHQPVLLQGSVLAQGAEAASVSVCESTALAIHSSPPQLGSVLGGGSEEGRTGDAILPSGEVAASRPPTSHLCAWRPTGWGPGVAERLLQSAGGELGPRASADFLCCVGGEVGLLPGGWKGQG